MNNAALSYNFNDVLPQSFISARLRKAITSASILLFIGLVIFVSFAVNNYVNDTLSITLIQPEESDELQDSVLFKEIIVKKGDTIKSILIEQNIPKNDIKKILNLVKESKLSLSLKIGQKITFEYEVRITENDNHLTSEIIFLNKIIIAINKLKTIEIVKKGDDFQVEEIVVPLSKKVAKSSVIIESNFISALKKLGLSDNSIIEIVNIYSYQVDFQRQIKSGDTATVITEKYVTEDGKFSHHGKVLYVSLNLSGKEYNIYRYSHDNNINNQAFFSEDGKSVKRSLLKTPLKVIKVSSRYGNRKHPILGYTKMHKGVDFVAPAGTPIYSAGNGVVTEIGWKSGYGKFIQVKHSSTLSTAYAHASNFVKSLKVGSIVKQGQVIAFVGNTGRATGPHLHYEVKINGKNVNPMSVKTTPDIELSGKSLEKFKQFKREIKALNIKLDKELQVDKVTEVSL